MQSINTVQLPFDVSFHFNEELREIPNAPSEMRRAIQFFQAQLDDRDTDIYQQIRLYGIIGVCARILGEFSLAHTALKSAIALSEEVQEERLKTINELRLAHVYQWQRQFEVSDRRFAKVLVHCARNPVLEPYLDFAYHHAGISKFDQAQYAKAQWCFEQALAIRRRKGDCTLIKSTRFALEITQQRIRSGCIAQRRSYRHLKFRYFRLSEHSSRTTQHLVESGLN
jgi:tetratricopeptide (TPR) repeat protein